MWITVEPHRLGTADLLLPATLADQFASDTVQLRFGARVVPVTIARLDEDADPGVGTNRSSPAVIRLAPKLIRKLFIRTEPDYRIRVTESEIEIGPVLGLLLGNRNHWYDEGYVSREPERIADVYQSTGGLIVAFSGRNLSLLDRCAYGLYYDPLQNRWRYGALPLPSVAYRRSFHRSAMAVDQLQGDLGIHLFNSRRYDKWQLHELLSEDPWLAQHLPETALITKGFSVSDWVDRSGPAILKPADLSRGRGILFVLPDSTGYRLIDCRKERNDQRELSKAELDRFVQKSMTRRPYLCQRKLDLAVIAGAPFDIRVVMQRTPAGEWSCTGIECRVAAEGHLVTNLASGGRALWLADALQQAFDGRLEPESVHLQVKVLAHRFCTQLDETGARFAEFGIDLALDREGKLWFIEANVLPVFHGFRSLDRPLYRQMLRAPMLYASSLAGFPPIDDDEKGGRDDETTGDG
jgi:hypothetical protein